MKKIILTALILALSYASFAQQGPPRGQRQALTPEQMEQMQIAQAQRQTEQMKTNLKLDEEQERTIGAINLKYVILRTQISEAARADQSLNLRELLNELDERRLDEILPILNEDQIEAFLKQRVEEIERREQRFEERRQRGGEQRGGGRIRN